MFWISNADLPMLLAHPIVISQTSRNKSIHLEQCRWCELLDSVQNEQMRFQVKWVQINNRLYQKLSYSIDKPFPVPIAPPPSLLVPGYPPSSYELRVFIQNPPKAYELSNTNNLQILDELLKLFDDQKRAWAANILISKMLGVTGLDSKIHQISPSQWWELEGKTQKAKQEWTQYLQKVKPSMVWSPLGGYYKHRAPDGRFIL
jgi:hypothetical protein